jgi:guanylate kinase
MLSNSKMSAESEATNCNPVPNHGMLFVVSSPSGGGKGTLIQRALKSVANLSYSISYTTREPRDGELDGREYHFVSVEEFQRLIGAGEFLEWATVFGNLYGTGRTQIKKELAEGRDLILELDVQGAASLRELANGTISIFIIPPSFRVLSERLNSRGTESKEELEIRLNNSRHEMEQYSKFDYVIVNDDINQASAELASIISAERARRKQREAIAREVLATFPNQSTAA